jgi:hypothetical protein
VETGRRDLSQTCHPAPKNQSFRWPARNHVPRVLDVRKHDRCRARAPRSSSSRRDGSESLCGRGCEHRVRSDPSEQQPSPGAGGFCGKSDQQRARVGSSVSVRGLGHFHSSPIRPLQNHFKGPSKTVGYPAPAPFSPRAPHPRTPVLKFAVSPRGSDRAKNYFQVHSDGVGTSSDHAASLHARGQMARAEVFALLRGGSPLSATAKKRFTVRKRSTCSRPPCVALALAVFSARLARESAR